MKKQLALLAIFLLLFSCNKKEDPIVITSDNFHDTVDNVTDIMIHDIFSPPVASRIYAYPNIAAYEIIAHHNKEYTSLAGQVRDLTPIPEPGSPETINYQLASLIAHMELSKKLIFSEKSYIYGLLVRCGPF